jgi:hypothetical protein
MMPRYGRATEVVPSRCDTCLTVVTVANIAAAQKAPTNAENIKRGITRPRLLLRIGRDEGDREMTDNDPNEPDAVMRLSRSIMRNKIP